jgi:ABC-2 type transport system ATP-binding protein
MVSPLVPSTDVDTERRPVIEAVGLTGLFPHGRSSVRAVGFVVRAGEIYALVGGPGAGKTTIVDIVLGLQTAASGSVWLFGRNPRLHGPDVGRLVGFADAQSGLYPWMTPLQNLEFLLRLCRLSPVPSARERVNALRDMRVADRDLGMPLGTLPRAVGLATTLAASALREVRVLVLDDPTMALDSRAAAGVEDMLNEFRRRDVAVLLATSDVALARQVADRVGVLVGGEKVFERQRSGPDDRHFADLLDMYLGGAALAQASGDGGMAAVEPPS